jgi:fructose-1,6-bisphosphatase/inositol monophosphatase family enzyme
MSSPAQKNSPSPEKTAKLSLEESETGRHGLEDRFVEEIESVAKSAGNIVKACYLRGITHQFKSPRRVVTEADRESERLLKERLLDIYPCGFHGEEGGEDVTARGDQWVVDPLDGTENMNGYPPLMAVSVGLLRDGEPILGVIYDPIHAVLYSARRGRQVWVNGEARHVSRHANPENAIVSLDFSSEMNTRPRTLTQLSRVLERARSVKVLGTPALSLAEVAAGRLDLFFRPSTKLPDVAAGVCMVRESGGKALDYEGRDWTMHSNGIIAGSPEMVDLFLPCFSQSLTITESMRSSPR